MWKEALILIGTPGLRSCTGWLVNALEDGKISNFEWRKLAITFFQVGIPTAAIYFGFNSAGIDVGVLGAAAGGILFDMIRSAIKKRKK